MENLGRYLIGVAAAAFLCGILRQVSEKLGISGKLISMITGIFMAIALVSPIKMFHFPDFSKMLSQLENDAQYYVSHGQEIAYEQVSVYISEQVRTYILEKASALNANVEVSVDLDGAQLPAPQAVHISGAISPYARKILSAYIAEELAIPEENQIWTLSQ